MNNKPVASQFQLVRPGNGRGLKRVWFQLGISIVSRSQTLYLEKQRGKGLVKLPWQIGSGFLRC